jgi:hypothetical protein
LQFITAAGSSVFTIDASNDGSTDIFNADVGSVTLNTWQHLELTREKKTITLRIQGITVATVTTVNPIFFNLSDWILGGQSVGIQRSITGYMQEFLFFNYCLHTADFTPPITPFSKFSTLP